MQKIVTSLFFDGRAEEAAEFYTSLIPNSRVTNISYYGEGAPRPKGEVLTVDFELDGQQFIIINGGPGFPHSPAISLLIRCESQAEVDRLWEALSEGGEKSQCGWLTDRYGVSWQVVPTALERLLETDDDAQRDRVMGALLEMTRLDIAALERAYHDG